MKKLKGYVIYALPNKEERFVFVKKLPEKFKPLPYQETKKATLLIEE